MHGGDCNRRGGSLNVHFVGTRRIDGLVRTRIVGPDLHLGRPLNAAACAAWVDTVLGIEQRARAAGEDLQPPNSMHGYGLILDGRFGLRAAVDRMVSDTVSPGSERVFPEFGRVAAHHAFVVHYASDRDHELGFHVDDSDVTLNLCLGTLFEGGDLIFSGRRCAVHRQGFARPEEQVRFAHVPGAALLHAGAHRHEAVPLVRGRRLNLIVWCKSVDPAPASGHPGWCAA